MVEALLRLAAHIDAQLPFILLFALCRTILVTVALQTRHLGSKAGTAVLQAC